MFIFDGNSGFKGWMIWGYRYEEENLHMMMELVDEGWTYD